jgi:DNA-binding NarL/FixJ family response regulator
MSSLSIPLTSQSQSRLRVLLVDDNPDVLQDLHILLEISGTIEIVGDAADGLEALKAVAELHPDVVVMDLEMPGMDGYEATRRIKAGPHPPRVVILSVHGEPEVIDRLRRAGADSFVLKGASYEMLVDAIMVRPAHKPNGAWKGSPT